MIRLNTKIDLLLSSGIIAVVRKIEANKVMDVISALVDGGVTGIEVTLDSENVFEVIGEAQKKFGERVVVGAGTVLDGTSARMAIQAGADFIFAPTLSRETIEVTKRYGKIVIPGVFTPTEILQATEWGADVVKIFPASVLGSQFIKDVRGPLGHIKMMPTGGITLENVGEYIRAGAVAAGVGSSLLDKKMISTSDWVGLSEHANNYVNEVKKAKM